MGAMIMRIRAAAGELGAAAARRRAAIGVAEEAVWARARRLAGR
jgi:hypothetical protein